MAKLSQFLVGVCLIALVVLVSPVVILWLVGYAIYTLALYLLVWIFWIPQGKDILFVYSNSPLWEEHVQSEIIPRIRNRALILNWSERKQWSTKRTLQAMVFRRFGGSSGFNPMGLYFRPFHRVKSNRFLNAFRDWKHGNHASLKKLEGEFFADIGHLARHSTSI